MSKMLFLPISLLVASFTTIAADETLPNPNTRSVFFPASMVCHGQYNNSYTTTLRTYQGNLEVTNGGAITCAIPFEPDTYINSIVVTQFLNTTAQRSCKLGLPKSISAGSASWAMASVPGSNNSTNYRYDDLGAIPAYSGGNPNTFILMNCEHWNPGAGGYVRYGHIRVDYNL